ncbi:MAG TPA: hypothetical protein VES68_01170 [Candidatus Sulfotelmatobacter sp.]|nr:hypothetical protein [Candidatus Sulfotelmatobacter sp.]
MKKYRIILNTGENAIIDAVNEEDLKQKLSSGHYGVLPLRGRQMVRFTPANIKEIIEEEGEAFSDLFERIDEGLNNLQERTNFNALQHKNLIPVIKASIKNYKKSRNPQNLKGLIDEFHQTAIATTEGADAYNVNIWDTDIDVKGKQITLEELFTELENLYFKLLEKPS